MGHIELYWIIDIGAFNILGPESRDRGRQAEVLSESMENLIEKKAIFVKQKRNTKFA